MAGGIKVWEYGVWEWRGAGVWERGSAENSFSVNK